MEMGRLARVASVVALVMVGGCYPSSERFAVEECARIQKNVETVLQELNIKNYSIRAFAHGSVRRSLVARDRFEETFAGKDGAEFKPAAQETFPPGYTDSIPAGVYDSGRTHERFSDSDRGPEYELDYISVLVVIGDAEAIPVDYVADVLRDSAVNQRRGDRVAVLRRGDVPLLQSQ